MKKYLNQPPFTGSDMIFSSIKKKFALKNSPQKTFLQNTEERSVISPKPWWRRKFVILLISLAGLIGLVSLGVGGAIIGGILQGEPIVEAAKLEPTVVMSTGIQTDHLTFANKGLLLYSSTKGINSFNIFSKKDENLIALVNFSPSELVDLKYDQGKIALAWQKKVDLYNQAGQLISSKSEPKMLVSSIHLSVNVMLIVYHPQDIPLDGMLKTEFIFYDLLTDKIISRHYIPGSRQVIDVLINETSAQIIAENSYQYIPPAAIQITMHYQEQQEKFYQLADLQVLPGAKKALFDQEKKVFWLDNAQPNNVKQGKQIVATAKNLLLGRFDRQLFYYQALVSDKNLTPTLTLISTDSRKYNLSIAKDLTLYSTGQIINTEAHQYLMLPAINKLGQIEIILVLNDAEEL